MSTERVKNENQLKKGSFYQLDENSPGSSHRSIPYQILPPLPSIENIHFDNKKSGMIENTPTSSCFKPKENRSTLGLPIKQAPFGKSPSFNFLDPNARSILMQSKNALASSKEIDTPRREPRTQLPTPIRSRLHRKSVRRPRVFAEHLEGLKAVGDSKKLHEAEVNIVQKLVINGGYDLREKMKMLDSVR